MQRHMEPGPHFGGRSARRDLALVAEPAGSTGMNNQINVEFESGPDAAAAARNALFAIDGKVDEELLNDVRLLVSELVTNSVRHSGKRGHAIVRMRVDVDPSTVRVEVSDPGEGFEPKPRDNDRSRPGGWGLYLVDQLADRWGVMRDQLTRVWFEMDQHRHHGRNGHSAAA